MDDNIIKILREYQEDNDEIFIVSATLFPIAKCVADFLGIKHVIATKLIFNNEICTGEVKGRAIYGEVKRFKVNEYINQFQLVNLPTYAYADHYSDLELLKFVDYPIVINPDNQLYKVAKNKNWTIHDFRDSKSYLKKYIL